MNEQYRNAIGSVESDNDYEALGPVTKKGDRAYGRYQVMGANIPEWTRTHLGVEMTPDQFLADPSAQDKVFDAVTGSYHKKYGNVDDVTSSWFSGRPVAQAGNDSDGYNTVPTYIAKVNKAMNGVDAINSAAGIKPMGRGALTSAFNSDDDAGALSTNNVQGLGALSPMAQSPEPDKLGTIGRGLTGIGAALAGISSPDQAKALTAQMVAQQKTPTEGGTWSLHTLPDGKTFMLNSKTRAIVPAGVHAKPEEDPYQKKFKEEDAKAAAELGTNLSTAARDAANQATSVAELRRTLSNPEVYQGTGGPAVQTLRKAYSALGFGDAQGVADGDVATALSNKLALQLVNSGGSKLLPGSFSDSDRKFVAQMATSLSNNPDANQRLLDIYERANARVMEAEALRQKHVDGNGGIITPKFRGELSQLSSKWSAEDKQRNEAEAKMPKQSAAPSFPKGVKSIQIIQP